MVAAGRGWLAIVAMPEQSDSAAGAFQAMSSTADRDTAPPRRCIPPSPSIPHQSGNYQRMFSHKQQAGSQCSVLLLPLPPSCHCTHG